MSTKPYISVRGSAERPHSAAVNHVMAAVRHWGAHAWERRRQRKALASLDNRLLKDVGLTQDDVRNELKKPFWQ